MTKKGKSGPQSGHPQDFFADVSADLKMQFEEFSEPQETTADAPQEAADPSLFATDASESPNADETALFDTDSAVTPPPDDSVSDAVPYPAALSDVALEQSLPHSQEATADAHVDVDAEVTGQPEESDNSLAAHNPLNESAQDDMKEKETNEAESTQEATRAPETVEFGTEQALQQQADAEDFIWDDEEKPPTDSSVDASTAAPASDTTEEETQAAAEESTPSEEVADTNTEQPEETVEAAEETVEATVEAAEETVESTEETVEAAEAEESNNPDSADGGEEEPIIVVQQKATEDSSDEDEDDDAEDTPSLVEQRPFRSSQPDTEITEGSTTYKLLQAVEHSPDRTVWSGINTESDAEVLIHECSPARYRSGLQHFPEIEGLQLHNPTEIIEREDRAFAIFTPLEGYLLTERLRDPQYHWTIGQLRKFIRSLARNVHLIHQAGYLCLNIDEHHIWVDEEKQPLLYDIDRVFSDRTPFHLRPINEGFSGPELYDHHIPVGPHTDIFALGALVHYMISQCPAFNHLDLPNAPIPSPRVYQLDFPVGLDHVLEQAMHPNLERRFANVPEFMNSLERALQEIEERHRQPLLPLQLNVGHDIHIGINKGLRNPVNQDALFWRYDREHNKGMFLIADGVSHCHYGSGDRASSILIQAARQTWDALSESPLMEQHLDYKQRRGVLNSVFAAANRAIASEVNELYDRVEGYVEDVMGSTCVGGFIDANQITVTNLGDSRAYLKTAHYIEQISVDHDYKTAQLQIGQDLRSLQNLMGGSLITRCVGSCRKDEQLKVVPLQLQADFFDLALIPGDTIVFCSDGLSDYAGETEEEARDMISKIIDVHTEPISACFWMVALANQRGGGDNISVIEIKVLDHA